MFINRKKVWFYLLSAFYLLIGFNGYFLIYILLEGIHGDPTSNSVILGIILTWVYFISYLLFIPYKVRRVWWILLLVGLLIFTSLIIVFVYPFDYCQSCDYMD